MPNFISEDQIEQALLHQLNNRYGFVKGTPFFGQVARYNLSYISRMEVEDAKARQCWKQGESGSCN